MCHVPIFQPLRNIFSTTWRWPQDGDAEGDAYGDFGLKLGLTEEGFFVLFCFFLGNTGPAFPTALAFPVPLSLL